MRRRAQPKLGDLELRILIVLWERQLERIRGHMRSPRRQLGWLQVVHGRAGHQERERTSRYPDRVRECAGVVVARLREPLGAARLAGIG